jgi:thiol-disulfide isomerase/thioredoxin
MKYLIRIFLLSALVLAYPGNAFADTGTRLKVGLDGKIDFSAYKGKVIYLDYWASWCKPCRQSFSWMNKMHERYGKDDLVIIAVSLDADKKQAKSFLQKIPAKFNIAYDPDGITAEAYGLKAMPTSYLINRKGKLVHTAIGFHGGKTQALEARIKQLLGKSSVASR